MTNEEAICTLAKFKRYISGGGVIDRQANSAIDMAIEALKQPQIIRCKDCKWYEKLGEDSSYGYCHAMKHCHYSKHWEISIYRTYNEDFFCADAERREEE